MRKEQRWIVMEWMFGCETELHGRTGNKRKVMIEIKRRDERSQWMYFCVTFILRIREKEQKMKVKRKDGKWGERTIYRISSWYEVTQGKERGVRGVRGRKKEVRCREKTRGRNREDSLTAKRKMLSECMNGSNLFRLKMIFFLSVVSYAFSSILYIFSS